MKTIDIADMMADYILNHKWEYKIDIWLDRFIEFWSEWDKLRFKRTEWNKAEWTWAKEFTVDEIKNILLEWMGVYEEDIKEIIMDESKS